MIIQLSGDRYLNEIIKKLTSKLHAVIGYKLSLLTLTGDTECILKLKFLFL